MSGKKTLTKTSKNYEAVNGRDTFETPAYAVSLLLPFIPEHIKFVWECACGDGRILSAMYANKTRPWVFYNSDIRESKVRKNNIGNFLTDSAPMLFSKDNWAIITNPPFSIKEEFVEKAFEYGVPFAFLINADYSGRQIDWIQRGCEKIIPTRRINYLTPNILKRIHEGEIWKVLEDKKDCDTLKEYQIGHMNVWITDLWVHHDLHNYTTLEEVPNELLAKYSSSQFHSMWLTYGFGLGRTETFVDLPLKEIKENIICR